MASFVFACSHPKIGFCEHLVVGAVSCAIKITVGTT